MVENLKVSFKQAYGKEAYHAFFCPGRVNLIGEHIDYNGGLVMPCAVTFGTYLLTAFNDEGVFRFKSLNFDEEVILPLTDHYTKTGSSWFNYPLGMIDHFQKSGKQLQGLDLLYFGNIPIGSGLSSSASIEIVTGYALNELFHVGFDRLALVKLAKSVENNFIGLNCGIMDMFAVAFGEENKAMMLNCETLACDQVDFDLGDYLLAIINTNKPRKLAESKYNERVQECAVALQQLQQKLDIEQLCDIDPGTFKAHQYLITDEVVLNRAQHVIEENNRVKEAAAALASGDLTQFGRLMYASHFSLRDLYEVSGPELDTVVEYAIMDTDVVGARMTGAGFGGCAIALVKKAGFDKFSDELTQYYTAKIGYSPSIYSSRIGNGAARLSIAEAAKERASL